MTTVGIRNEPAEQWGQNDVEKDEFSFLIILPHIVLPIFVWLSLMASGNAIDPDNY